jgi:hypothetical protein
LSRLVVLHGSYGCDTGCCGHWIELEDGTERGFTFLHPYSEDARKFAEELIREEFGEEHVADLDWENSIVTNA